MSRSLLLICALCVLAFVNALPVVISRYGGGSSGKRKHEMYDAEENKRVNTCLVACAVNTHITTGKCPSFTDEYKKLFTRGSTSFLEDYYRRRCDVVVIKDMKPNYFCAFLGTRCIILASLSSVACTIGLATEIFSKIIIFV